MLSLKAGSVIAEFSLAGDDPAAALKQLIANPPSEIAGAAVLSLSAAKPLHGAAARASPPSKAASVDDDDDALGPVLVAKPAAALGSASGRVSAAWAYCVLLCWSGVQLCVVCSIFVQLLCVFECMCLCAWSSSCMLRFCPAVV